VIHPVVRQTHQGLINRGRLEQFLILLSFGVTFVLARIIVYLQTIGSLPVIFRTDPHIHHLVPGILLTILGGYLGIAFYGSRKINLLAAILFGIGVGLTLDEFALWLNLRDVYFEEAGRASIDAVIITATILGLIFLISEAHDHRWFPFRKPKNSANL
jgi:hypothetical protein